MKNFKNAEDGARVISRTLNEIDSSRRGVKWETHDANRRKRIGLFPIPRFWSRKDTGGSGWSSGTVRAWAAAAPIVVAMLLIPAPGFAGMDPIMEEALEEHTSGNERKAIEIYTEYIRKNPGSAEAFNWRGMAYADRGKLDKAIADYGKAINLSANYSDPYNNRGEIYRRKGEHSKALKDYQTAIRLDKNFAEPHYNIGLVYEAMGKKGLAAKSFLTYLKANPAEPDRKSVLKKIQTLGKSALPRKRPTPPTAKKPVAKRPPSGKPIEKTRVATRPAKKTGRPVPPGMVKTAQQKVGKMVPSIPGLPGGVDIESLTKDVPIPPEVLAVLSTLPELLSRPPDPFTALLWLAVYLFFSFMLYLIARKTGVGPAWLAFVPILSVYVMIKSGGKPGWWFILLLIPLVNIIIFALVSFGIARERRKSAFWGLLFFIPCTHPLALLYLGLSR